MSEPKPARPSQVTMAGWLVMAGSVVVVVLAFVQVAGLHSLETREAVEEALSKAPADSLGLGVQGVLSLMRIALMVAAACAAASAILGWQALQRSKGARVALSALAVPLFLTGLVTGGIASAVVTAAIVMLWFQPARDWFDGVTRTLPPAPLPPAPHQPVGRDPLLDLPPPTAPPLHATAYAAEPASLPATSTTRPTAVTWACGITWVATATVFAVFALFLADFVADPGQFLEQFHQQNPDLTISDSDLKQLMIALSVVSMAWSAAAAGLAVLVWRRVAWAAVALGVSAALACVVLLPLPAGVATVVLLLRSQSRAWLSG